MLLRRTFNHILWAVFVLTFPAFLKAQEVSFESKNAIVVCDVSALNITLTNTTSEDLPPTIFTLNLPCGIEYVPSSISGAIVESDISNLKRPKFGVPLVRSGRSYTFSIQLNASCSTLNCLDRQEIFYYNAEWNLGSSTKSFTSDPLRVESPNLIIYNIDDVYTEIPSFKSKTRNIGIANRRNGRLQSFELVHKHGSSLKVSYNLGTVIATSPEETILRFSGDDFTQIGNKDKYLDINEELHLVETILADACSYDIQFVRSDYTIKWGCENTYCQQNTAIANVRIVPNDDLGKKVSALPFGSEPFCYENGTALQRIEFNKQRHSNALEYFTVNINHYTGNNRGILVGSVTALWTDQILYQDTFRNDCGKLVAKEARLIRNRFNATAKDTSFVVTFLSAFCEESTCTTKENTWRASFFYNKECTVSSDKSHADVAALGNSTLLASKAFVDILDEAGEIIPVNSIAVLMTDGFKGILKFAVHDTRLPLGSGDTLFLDLKIPQGFILLNEDFLLNGVAPVAVQLLGQGSQRVYRLAYIMPIERTGTIFVPFIFNCYEVVPPEDCNLDYTECACTPPLVLDQISITSVLKFDGNCSDGYYPTGCDFVNYQIDCDNIEVCYRDTLPGGLQYTARLFRTSYGKPDPDFDGIADEGEPHTPEDYQLYNFIPGDSMKITFEGRIITNILGSTFKHLVLRMRSLSFFANDQTTSEFYQSLLLGKDGALKTYSSQMTLFKKKTGEAFVFDRVYERYHDQDILIYLSADTLRTLFPEVSLPADFVFEAGDSIYVEFLKFIDISHYHRAKDEIKLGDFFEYTAALDHFVGNDIPEPNFEPSPCDCGRFGLFFPEFLISQIPVSTGVSFQSAKLCNDQFTSINFLNLSFGHQKELPLPKGYVFPFEVKETILPTQIKIERNNEVEYGEITILYLGKVYRIAPTEAGDYFVYDLKAAGMLPAGAFSKVEQRHILKLSIGIRPKACVNFTPNVSSELKMYFDLTPVGKIYYKDSITTNISISFPRPDIQMALFQKEVTAFSNEFNTKFTVCCPKLINVVENVYFRILNPSGNISNLQLRDTITGEIYTSVQGIFNIGALTNQATRFFELSGISKGCGKEKLLLEYGFDCLPYTDPAVQPCFRSYDSLEIHFPKAIVDLIADDTDHELLQLCDTISQQVTWYNAGLGTAFDVRIAVQLPPGVRLAPGSAILYYPTGTRDRPLLLPDVALQDGKYIWDLKAFWDMHAMNGLAGATSVPENGFDLVFSVVTDCASTSGLPILYHLAANDGCGNPINRLTKAGSVLDIEHDESQEAAEIFLEAAFVDACQRDRMTLSLKTKRPSEGSSNILVSLPQGWTVDTATLSGNLTDNMPRFDQGLYLWNSSSDDEDLVLEFEIIHSSANYCMTDNISAYISSSASADCIASGAPCEVNVISGSTTIPLIVQMPEYAWLSSSVAVRDGQIEVHGSIEQISGFNIQAPLSAKIVVDINANGIFDPDDFIVGNIDFSTWNPSNISVSTVVIDSAEIGSICHLLLVLATDTNCICSDLVIPIRDISYNQGHFDICSGDTLSIGIEAHSNDLYQWNAASGLGCTQCSETTFNVLNSSTLPVRYDKVLTVLTDSGCSIRYLYSITVNPLPNVAIEDLSICQSDTVFIIASPAVSYEWSGPNILQNNQQILVALPDSSTLYQYVLTNEYGCSSDGIVNVHVDLPPAIRVLHDPSLCPTSEARILIEAFHTSSFTWTDGVGRLSDIYTLNPSVLVLEDYDFGLQLINGNCRVDTIVSVRFYPETMEYYTEDICDGDTYMFGDMTLHQSGRYCLVFQNVYGCDSTVCIDLEVRYPEVFPIVDTLFKESDVDLIIRAPEGYTGYAWSPPDFLSCLGCSAPFTTTPETIIYTVILVDDIGCTTEKRYNILVNQGCKEGAIFLPNAFSPNGDGINDVYTLRDIQLCGQMHIRVYNRWGNLVFEDSDWDNQWDGSSNNGEHLPQGTYFIEIEFGKGFVKSGMVDLRKQ